MLKQTRLSSIFLIVILFGILLIAFFFRIQGSVIISEGHFTSADAYFYYWHAQLVSEHGTLPERDMHRWLPIGRDLEQTLNLYVYVLSYTHKALSFLFSSLTLYQVCFYMPVACFCIALCVLSLFLYRTFGPLFSSIVGILLATLPGSIERSAAGFGDRDAFCLMLGLLSVITYLMSLQAETPKKRLIWTFTSGFTVFLGGLSWEGFGVFLSVILIVELWRFLASETEDGLELYGLWVCCFVPPLYFASPAYRSGYGFATYLFALMLVPPVFLLGIRVLRHFLISRRQKLRSHARTLALGLTLASVALALGYVFTQLETFAYTTVPFSQSTLMQSVSELHDPYFAFWGLRYGSIFFCGCIGLILVSIRLWNRYGIVLAVALTVFCLTTFFRDPLRWLWETSFEDVQFYIAVSLSGLMLILVASGV